MDFVGFPKIPRYSRECVITEKIDGTNAQIYIPTEQDRLCNLLRVTEDNRIRLGEDRVVPFLCGSRSRWIFPENDNHGFAKWAYENAEELLRLGPGRHFGEWWGQGIQRGYGLKEKRFSLFNIKRWADDAVRPACCHVVPVIVTGTFAVPVSEDKTIVDVALSLLRDKGSFAAPGFMKPEGVIIYHVAGNILFKKTLEDDEKAKTEA